MLLSYYSTDVNIPHTSTCTIKSSGIISDGDMIEITSPLFSSINFTSDNTNLSDTLNVKVKLETHDGTNTEVYKDMEATLVCDDGDVNNMYVRI